VCSSDLGAPVVAFCRISEATIRLREPIMQPDAIIIQDPTLLNQVDVFQGLKANGYILINSTRSFDDLGLSDFVRDWPLERLATVPATEFALKHVGRPVPNAALLGGFAAISGVVSLAAVSKAIREKFPEKLAESNIAAATAAYEFVKQEIQEAKAHA
jgi:pyruvate ferredoxin oxidoreductase gamma subunit